MKKESRRWRRFFYGGGGGRRSDGKESFDCKMLFLEVFRAEVPARTKTSVLCYMVPGSSKINLHTIEIL